jgi:hypothetical protein
MTVHLKDQVLRPYESGFLFGDAALGEGFLDLPAMVKVLRAAQPDLRFHLEVITRDPLRVPVLLPAYHAPMGQIPASDLARALRSVRTLGATDPLEMISELTPEDQVAAETRNVRHSIEYARETLAL